MQLETHLSSPIVPSKLYKQRREQSSNVSFGDFRQLSKLIGDSSFLIINYFYLSN